MEENSTFVDHGLLVESVETMTNRIADRGQEFPVRADIQDWDINSFPGKVVVRSVEAGPEGAVEGRLVFGAGLTTPPSA